MTAPIRPVTVREGIGCVICRNPIRCWATTSPHPEAPELLAFDITQAVWVGIMAPDEPGGDASLIVVCGKACADRLLEEG